MTRWGVDYKSEWHEMTGVICETSRVIRCNDMTI